jgi:hypothetical protein
MAHRWRQKMGEPSAYVPSGGTSYSFRNTDWLLALRFKTRSSFTKSV